MDNLFRMCARFGLYSVFFSPHEATTIIIKFEKAYQASSALIILLLLMIWAELWNLEPIQISFFLRSAYDISNCKIFAQVGLKGGSPVQAVCGDGPHGTHPGKV